MNKEIRNASWIVIGQIAQLVVHLLISILTTRYLGPSNYGQLNYVNAYVTLFTSLCNLGLNTVILKEYVDNPEQDGLVTGTAVYLRIVSSVLSAILIVFIVGIGNQFNSTLLIIAFLSSVSLIFQSYNTINYWFQSQYKSKISSIVTFLGYVIASVYRLILLILKKDVIWFAFATSLDYLVIAVLLVYSYKRHKGNRFSFSWSKAKEMMGKSYHYILSGVMVSIYQQTDKIMINHMLSDTDVGYYSTATNLCVIWVFLLTAIIDSMSPTIYKLYKEDRNGFDRKNRQLFAIVFYLSMFVSLVMTVFAPLIIRILYGTAYLPSAYPLRVAVWYVAFSYLGVARNAWILCENKQKYLKYMYFSAAIINVGLNAVLIPVLGTGGAALASLVTQISTCIILPALIPDMRPNVVLMIDGIRGKNTFSKREIKELIHNSIISFFKHFKK